MSKVRWVLLSMIVAIWLWLATPVSARAFLISASPMPNSTLDKPPTEVRLIFNTPIELRSVSVRVVDAVGRHVDKADTRFVAAERPTVVVSLPPLEEGLYTVTYTVTERETGTTTTDSYQFALDYPTPQIRIMAPPNGAGVEQGALAVEVDTGDFDLSFWRHSWRLYVDAEVVATTQEEIVTVDDLPPGPHEFRATLVNEDGSELRETQTTIHIAVGVPDPEAEELAMAAAGPGAPGPSISRVEVILLGVAVALFLGTGIALGQRTA